MSFDFETDTSGAESNTTSISSNAKHPLPSVTVALYIPDWITAMELFDEPVLQRTPILSGTFKTMDSPSHALIWLFWNVN